MCKKKNFFFLNIFFLKRWFDRTTRTTPGYAPVKIFSKEVMSSYIEPCLEIIAGVTLTVAMHAKRATCAPDPQPLFLIILLSLFFLSLQFKMNRANQIASTINRWSRDGLDMLGGEDSPALQGLLADYFDCQSELPEGKALTHPLINYSRSLFHQMIGKRTMKALVVITTEIFLMVIILANKILLLSM